MKPFARVVVGVLSASCACGKSNPSTSKPAQLVGASAERWADADVLFHRDLRWLGADGAFSIPMGDGRVLWLFGDTFVAKTAANVRSESAMPRNTIAMQTGTDPRSSPISFYWRGTPGAPSSYFPEDGNDWYWPQHGIRIGKALVVFLARVAPTPGQGLGFRGDGWRAAVVDDASGSPDAWTPRIVAPGNAPAGIQVGAALNVVGDHIVSLADREPGDHAGFLVRWLPDDLAAGHIDAAEWWSGDGGWIAAGALSGDPAIVIVDAGPESSLHFDALRSRWVHLRSDGFGATTIVCSFAPDIKGPWSTPSQIFRPPESDLPGAFVYAGKAHPEISGPGPGDLVVTYAANAHSFGDLVANDSFYYPRFVRVAFPPP
jgi:hypothetical protein